ncbi:hypothetical protein ACJ5H2_18540 [Nocardioides sp. R1-1]|uniref:hypothetical protein n=1 Tax=Nocardioides sp. R1-1 TaxID=3383502 RepID=UPI0038D04617
MPDDSAAPDPTADRAAEREQEHAAFRSFLTPSHDVPRFDPLTEPVDDQDAFRRVVASGHAVPHFEPLEGAGTVPGFDPDVVRRRRSKRRRSHHRHRPRTARAAGAADGVSDEDVPTEEVTVEAAPAEAAPVEAAPAEAAPAEAAPVEAAPVEAAPVAEAAAERTEEVGRPAARPGPADRRETLIVVGVLAFLLVLAGIYVLAQRSDQPVDQGLPQGASLVSSQPAEERA